MVPSPVEQSLDATATAALAQATAPRLTPEELRDVLLQALIDLKQIHPGLGGMTAECVASRLRAGDWEMVDHHLACLRHEVRGAWQILWCVDRDAAERTRQWLLDLPLIPYEVRARRAG